MKRRVKVKVVKDKHFRITVDHSAKFWVYLPDGRYFYIYERHTGAWWHEYSIPRDYPTEHEAIEDALARLLHPDTDGIAYYRRLRVRERVFTPDVVTAKEAKKEKVWEHNLKILHKVLRSKKRKQK